MLLFRRITFWLALLGALSAVALIVQLSAASPVPEPPLPPPAKPSARGIGASGIVEAQDESVELGVPSAGLVSAVYVKPWDKVAAGAPLLQLDDRDLRAQLISLQAQVSVSRAQLSRALDQSRRAEVLEPSGAISESELELRLSDTRVARSQVRASNAQIEQIEALLERLTVRAPIDGTILQVNVRAGEFVTPGAAAAPVVLGDIDRVQVRADVDEQIAPRVKPGKDAVGYLKGDTQTPIPLEFVRIEPYVVPKRSLTGASTERVDTRVLQVIFKFPDTFSQTVYVGQQIDLYIEE